jgi:hypothetical protein
VHGDFHHHNILRHGDGFVAIDPKPYFADREYDVPSLLWNPLGNRLGTLRNSNAGSPLSSPPVWTTFGSARGRSFEAPTYDPVTPARSARFSELKDVAQLHEPARIRSSVDEA